MVECRGTEPGDRPRPPIGQQKPVTVFKLIAKDSIEEKIQQLQEKKLNLADEIIGGEQVAFSSLTREDLLDMIR